jgi:hypothetical protein
MTHGLPREGAALVDANELNNAFGPIGVPGAAILFHC